MSTEVLVSEETRPSFTWKSRLRVLAAELSFPVGLFFFSRLALFLLARVSLLFDPRLHRAPFKQEGLAGLDAFCKWDCGWYAEIARQGYERPEATNFFPFLPLTAKFVSDVTGVGIPVSLVLVANVGGLLSLLVLYRLFRLLEGEEVARVSLLLFTAYPFVYFQSAGYPESWMVFFTALAVLLGLRGHPWWAAVALGFGGLARHLSLVAGLGLLFQQLRSRGGGVRAWFHRDLLALALPLVMTSLYFVFLWRKFGDPQVWWKVRGSGWAGAWDGLWSWWSGKWGPEVSLFVVASFIPGVGALLLARHRRWWTLAAFAIPLMLVLWSVGLVGLGRYSASVWPAFLPLGAWLSRHPALRGPVVLGMALFQGMLVFLFVHAYPIN
ncbi:mannosyltransferase family protein [Myxococcus landrumensis]|uniref:Glycosyltransferase family 39 protein n=1 Tax=Myxococcus landrumensis TaxID=2813577 RepID=A0ABX7NCH1_9BACT|nr:glycosyltransferase family 39 protein [Myxococcus landrumus]QSQ15307.1 glycosyltransferase family 39 protein [Myxococcus landrumus]